MHPEKRKLYEADDDGNRPIDVHEKRKLNEADEESKRPTTPARDSDLVSRVRGQVAKSLSPKYCQGVGTPVKPFHVKQNIKEIRAILAMNAEILNQCMKLRKQNSFSTFVRYSFAVVESFTIVSKTQFVTYPEKLEKEFDMAVLSNLPAGIDSIFLPPKEAYTNFINYEALFEKSLILHDDVLGPFLEQFKVHLVSSVQVCLREIETWLMEPGSNIQYIESKFGVKLELPEENEILTKSCTCPAGTHSGSLVCVQCKKELRNHIDSSSTTLKKKCYSCPYLHDVFQCSKFNLLKEWNSTLPGSLELKFNIAKLHDRKKLDKVLELMEMVEDEDTSNEKK